MEENYKKVKSKASELGLIAELIIKFLELQKFAEENKAEFYVLDGKLKMKEKVKPFTKEDKIKLDGMFGKSKGPLDEFNDIFGKK